MTPLLLIKQGSHKSVLALTLTGFTIMACTPTDIGVNFAQPVAVSRNDPCSSNRAPFAKLKSEQNARLANWATAGATVGLTAALVGGGDADAMLRGLIGGALLGLAGGYIADVQARYGPTANLRSAINGDARRNVAQTDTLIRALSSLNSCRVRQINKIAADVRTGRVDKKTGKAQLRVVQSQAKADNRLIQSVVGDLTRTRNTYVNALKSTGATNADAYVASLSRYEPKVRTPRVTSARSGVQGSLALTTRKRSGSGVAQMGNAGKELSTLSRASSKSIGDAIEGLESLGLFTLP